MTSYQSKDADQMYKTNLLSVDGKLFQLAYADLAAYLSDYLLQLRTDSGKWYLFESKTSVKDNSISKRVASNQKCLILKDNSMDHIFDKRLGILISFFGHWYSRSTDVAIIRDLLNSHDQKADSGYLLRKILNAHRADGVGPSLLNLDQEKEIDYAGLYFDKGRPYPTKGHTITAISAYEKGLVCHPSKNYECPRIISMGGGSYENCNKLTSEILSKLNVLEATSDFEGVGDGVVEEAVTSSNESGISVTLFDPHKKSLELLGYLKK